MEIKQIDFGHIFKVILRERKRFFVALPIAFVLSSLLIICVPRTYTTTVTLAPELSSTSGTGSLSQMASSFGIDLGGGLAANSDAISPDLYPDVMKSIDFKVGLFPIHVKTIDGEISTDYYTYLLRHQKAPWWSRAIGWVVSLFASNDGKTGNGNGVDIFHLTKEQTSVMGTINGKISCSIDQRTYVIYVSVEDQDPLVSATMADSVRSKLQAFITDYRTSKAKNDLAFAEKVCADAKKRYEEARKRYAAFSDSNLGLTLEAYKTEKDDLENEMQLRYSTYSAVFSQLQAAKAKLQERTPAFTTIQSATVPLKPSGPKRVLFVLFVTFLTFMAVAVYVLYEDYNKYSAGGK